MEIKITTLTENTATQGFLAEWGLSILVQIDDLRILFDTGGAIPLCTMPNRWASTYPPLIT